MRRRSQSGHAAHPYLLAQAEDMQALAPQDRSARARETVAALFEAHGRLVLGVCRMLLRDPHEAEDAAQQAFLSAYRSLLGGTRPADAAAWLATIARNECRKRIARRMSTPVAAPLVEEVLEAPRSSDPLEQAERHAEVEVLRAALAELPERQREAVVLRDLYGLSYDEVSVAMSVSAPAVESLLSRGRRRLEERVRPVRVVPRTLVVPASLEDQLGRLIPDFAPAPGAIAAGGSSAGLVAKLVSLPLAGKAAAAAAVATLAVGTEVAVHHRGSDGRDGAALATTPVALPALHALAERQRVSAVAAPRPQAGRARAARLAAPVARPARPARRSHDGAAAPRSAGTEPASSAPVPAPSTDGGGPGPDDHHDGSATPAPTVTTDSSGPGRGVSGEPVAASEESEHEAEVSSSSGPSTSSGPGDGSGSSGSSDSSGSGSSGSGSSGSASFGSDSSGSGSDDTSPHD